MTETADSPYVVTMKGGTGYDAPWIVVRGDTATQVTERLRELFSENLGGFVVATADAFAKEWATGRVATPAPQQSAPVQAVVDGLSGTVIDQGPTPAPSNNQGAPAPGAPQGGQFTETDKWGGRWTHNHPKAPTTQFGAMVLREWKAQSGKDMKRWVDPRAKAVPTNYANGVRQDPADLLDGDWAKV